MSDDVTRAPDVDAVLDAIRRHRARHDADATFPVEALDAMRSAGLLGLLAPAEHGGAGGDSGDMIDVGQRLAREDLSAALIFVMHCQQVAALVRHARGRLREELLPRVARGEVYLASVTTERGKGGHLLSSDSPLSADDAGSLWLDRDAPVVTGAAHADGFLVTMRALDATAPSQVSLVYADRAQVEVKTAGDWQPLGMRASQSPPVRLVGSVPAHQVVGEHGDFRRIATAVFGPLAHLGWSACWLGAASGALARTVQHLRSPEGRKRYDVTSELLLTRLARARSRLEGVNALLDHCRETFDRADDVSRPPVQAVLNTLKITAAEQCHASVEELVELLGLQHGYLRNSPLWIERTLRDVRSASLNYHNDRLYLANGRLALLDPEVRLA
ncbi:MAG: acyl-CoA dehydrogenase family protein [Stackebrandtia sp.]